MEVRSEYERIVCLLLSEMRMLRLYSASPQCLLSDLRPENESVKYPLSGLRAPRSEGARPAHHPRAPLKKLLRHSLHLRRRAHSQSTEADCRHERPYRKTLRRQSPVKRDDRVDAPHHLGSDGAEQGFEADVKQDGFRLKNPLPYVSSVTYRLTRRFKVTFICTTILKSISLSSFSFRFSSSNRASSSTVVPIPAPP